MADDKETEWIPETGIMKPYLHLKPQYEVIYENRSKHNQKVVKVKLKNSPKYVIKHLRIKSTKKLEINELFREYRIANILGTLTDGIAVSRNIEKKEVEEYTVVEILMDYGGIPLSTFITGKELEKGDTMNIACQLLSTLTLMEELGVSHLDIKPLNIAWNKSKNRVKLIDFGTSLMSFGKVNRVFKELDNEEMGCTKKYAAPEIKEKGRKVIPQKLDVYSFAVTLLSLLAAEYKMEDPISCEKDSFIKKFNIEELKKEVRKEDTNGLWEEIYKIIEGTPESRPTFRKLREVFLKQAKGMTEDDHLLKMIYSLDKHPIKENSTQYTTLTYAYTRLFHLHSQIGNHDMAIKYIKKCLKIYTDFCEEDNLGVIYYYYILSILYYGIDKKEKFISYSEKALSILSKKDIKGNLLLEQLYKAMRFYHTSLGDYKRADEYDGKLPKTKSKRYEDLCYIPLELMDCIGDYEKLEEVHNKILEEIDNVKNMQNVENIQNKYIVNLYYAIGLSSFAKFDFKGAAEALNKALNIVLCKYGEQDPFLIHVYYFLGISNFSMDKLDQARELLDKASSISSAIYGEMSAITISINKMKAYCLFFYKGDYKSIFELFNKYLNSLLHKFGSQNIYVLTFYMDLGILYYWVCDFAKAKSHCLKALDIAENIFKKEYIMHIRIYQILGVLYLYEGNLDKAVNYQYRAFNIGLKALGEEHPLILEIYNNLIIQNYSEKKYQEVIRLCEIALGITLKTGRKKDLTLGRIYFYLGDSYYHTGNKELSISNTNEALKIFLSVHGGQNVYTASTYFLLGHIYQSEGDYVRSLEMSDKASKIMSKLFEECHPMAQGDQIKDNTNKAIESINKASMIPENIYEFNHYFILGKLCHSKKNHSYAEAAYKQALKISLNVFGELHIITTFCFFILGTLYVDLRNTKEAEKCFNKALNIQLRTLGETHRLIGVIYLELSKIYKWTNRYKEALCALEKCFKILNSDPRKDMNFLSIMNKGLQESRDIIKRINSIHIM